MPPTTVGLMSAINTGYRGEFNEGLAKADPFWQRIAMKVKSGTATEVYQNLGDFPDMEEWIGERQRKRMRSVDWAIKNKKYEGTLELPRTSVEDDQYGLENQKARALGDSAARLPDKLIATLLENGFGSGASSKGYDGVSFFNTAHPSDDGSTQGNKGTTALSAASYEAARAQMRNLKSASGVKLNIIPDLLVVPPALEGTAKRIVTAETVAAASGTASESNINKGTAEVLVVSRLTDADDWYLADSGNAGRILKPFIFQERQAPELVSKTNLNDDNVFWLDTFIWGARARGNAGYAMWQLIFGAHV